MAPNFADRVNRIEPFHVMDLLGKAQSLAAQGRDIIHLEVGEPDFPTPEAVVQAGTEAMAKGLTKYTPALGIPELRNKLSEFYRIQHHLTVSPDNIVITPGASGALLLALAATLNPGEELMLPEPGYPCNRHFAELLDIHPKVHHLKAEEHYRLNFERLSQDVASHTKGVLVASPGNPTGSVMDKDQQVRLAEFVSTHNLHLFMDEIYHGLIYDQSAVSILHACPNAWVMQSFSKYFQMTGWRLGWLVVPDGYVSGIEKLAQNLFLCPPAPAQYAALRALDSDVVEELEARKVVLKQRRDYLVPALTELGFKVQAPAEGAFYIYADASAFTEDAMTFCHELLEQAGVAITPGQDFGGTDWKTQVRFAYTTDVSVLEKAVERIRGYINAL